MHDQGRGPDRGAAADPQASDPVGTAHELLNVLAAVQLHVFMARRTFLAVDCGEQGSPSSSGPSHDTPNAPPATPADLLLRLETMVDRALGLANDLDRQVRALCP